MALNLDLDDLLGRIANLTPEQKDELEREIDAVHPDLNYWTPNPGPQADAYFSEADLLLYGGAAGGGKSDLGLGLAFTQHVRSLVIRRQYTDLGNLTDRAKQINGSNKGFKGSAPPRLTIDGYKLIDFGALKSLDSISTAQGNPHDLIYIDEAAQLTEDSIRLLMTWNRPGVGVPTDQRCRVVLGSNPPLSDEGMWMLDMFAPWLDPNHPNPAAPGELRWYLRDEMDRDVAVPDGGNYIFDEDGYPVQTDRDSIESGVYQAESRTFIPAKVGDNPYYATTDYKRRLDNLPLEWRAAMRDGIFYGAREDHHRQVIPSAWIKAAQDRWTPQPPDQKPMCNIGVDPARGGADDAVAAPRHDGWFAPLTVWPGRDFPSGKAGSTLAARVLALRENKADITIDMGGGYGDACYEWLKSNIDEVHQHKGAAETKERTAQGSQEFFNTRALVVWRFREALDPDQPGGSHIALPPDPKLYGELCAFRRHDKWEDSRVIKLETKVDLVKRLGYSPGRADGVTISWSKGAKLASHRKIWKSHKSGGKPNVKRSGRTHSSRRR